MLPPNQSPSRSAIGSFALIGVVVGIGAVAFAYTAGWFSPDRLTPTKLVDALAPPSGPSLGHRRNHAKGICFTGTFDANGNGAALSTAQVFARGTYPVIGRLNLATPVANAADSSARVRGIGLQFSTPDGQEWRTAMITAPVFPAATPQSFYELLQATASKDPDAMKNYAAAHPEIAGFGGWAKQAPWTDSYAGDQFNSLNSFVFTDNAGANRTVRWSMLPTAKPTTISPEELGKRGPDYLEQEITERVQKAPVSWTLAVTVANPEDPTADPTKAWPPDRRTVEVGTITARQIEAEPNGPCRDINFDPTVLPSGMHVSDDPFPAARSAAYSVSYNRRAAETDDYPYTASSAKP